MANFDCGRHLRAGQAIPALPLALKPSRRWDRRSQTALVRYYLDAGVGGLAVGVHSTQFAIRDPQIGLYEPVLRLAAEESGRWLAPKPRPIALIAGICGKTPQALREAALARDIGYHAGLLSLGAWAGATDAAMIRHCRSVSKVIPIVGFYLQPAAGGRLLGAEFWRRFADIDRVVAIKIAPFNRYQTIDVVRAVAESGRDDIALYTGNDDNIVADLLTPFRFGGVSRHIVGGLLGQWGVWTERAVHLLQEIKEARRKGDVGPEWLRRNAALTDANAVIFDAPHGFSGCLPGIHEILRRQGLLESIACLDRRERLSPGQAQEITRIAKAYPWMVDDAFVRRNLKRWRAE